MANATPQRAEHHGPEESAAPDAPGTPKEPAPRRARALLRRHRKQLPWAFLAVAAVVVGAFFLLRYLDTFEDTDDAQIDGNASMIAARVSGTVIAVHVEDNDRAKVGDLLVELDPTDYRVALEGAQANLAQGRSQRVSEAQANARLADIDLARSRRLVESGSLPPQDLDTHRSTAEARSAEVSAGRASVQSSQAQLEQARLNLDYTRISAPVAGIIAQKQVNVGDRVQPGQELLAIVQVDNLWVTANYKETQLRRMHPGQRADVHVEALGQTFRGHVESLPGATGTRFSLLPPENATGNYVKVVQRLPVRLRLEPGQPDLERLRPGMSVEPKVWLE
jgi:membrane fusion protein (multidrug efflux system)